VQIKASFEQLIIAMSTSARALQTLQADMSALVSRADELVSGAAAAAVPKADILPIFYEVGQMFEARGIFSLWQ
jgi:hypothetical protein